MTSGSPPRRYASERLQARVRRVLRRAGVTLLFVIAIFVGALSGIFLAYEKDLPQVSSLEDFEPNIITQVYTADGKLLGEFAIERRVVVGFKDIPPVLRNATIAVEDADFWKHLGVNPWRIPGAFVANLRAGRRTQGSSTLTMQLVRQPGLFLTPEKTYERKIKEAILAFELEKTFTKEEIFTYYCNQVYFGHGNYGVEAASEFLFSKSIKDLTLPEAALLAGLPQSPARLSPVEHPERALQRRNHVLQRMVDEKYISPEEAKAAQAAPLHLSLKREPAVHRALFPGGGPQVPREGVRVTADLPGRPARVHDARLGHPDRGQSRRARLAARAGPPFARLRAAHRDACSRTASSPTASTSRTGNGPIAVGDVVRGVVLASERGLAVVRIGEYEARVGPAEIAWTRRSNVAEVLKRGHGGALPHRRPPRGGGQGPQGDARAGAGGPGRAPGPRARDGSRARDGGRLRLRAQQVQPRHPGLAAGGLRLQAVRLRRRHREGRLHARHHHRGRARLLPRQQHGLDAAQLRLQVRGADPDAARARGQPERARHQDARGGGREDGHRLRAQARASRATCRPTCPSPWARARPRSWR